MPSLRFLVRVVRLLRLMYLVVGRQHEPHERQERHEQRRDGELGVVLEHSERLGRGAVATRRADGERRREQPARLHEHVYRDELKREPTARRERRDERQRKRANLDSLHLQCQEVGKFVLVDQRIDCVLIDAELRPLQFVELLQIGIEDKRRQRNQNRNNSVQRLRNNAKR